MNEIVGIDFSLTSPCICTNPDQTENFRDCKFYYLTNRKKLAFPHKQYNGKLHEEYYNDSNRYDNIANWALDKLDFESNVYLEGYAFGAAAGRVFQIAENTGILKYRLWKADMKIYIVEPSKAKKFFTGKGNASKFLMEQVFRTKTGINIYKELGTTTENPASDIIDSYAIYLYGLSQMTANNSTLCN